MVTGLPPHLIPINAAALADNIEFDRLGGFRAVRGESNCHQHSSAERITGIVPYTKMSGTKVLYAVESTLYEWDTVGASALSVSTAFSSGFHPHGVNYSDVLYGYIYDEFPFRYDGTSLYLAGISAPTATPSATTAGSGALASGAYSIYYSYYDSVNGREGNLSPAGSVTAGASATINITNLLDYTSAGEGHPYPALIDQKRVYRTSLGGGTAFLAATIDASATSASITASSIGTVSHLNTYGLPPQAKYCAMWDGRVWAGNISGDKTNVYYSHALYPERWDTVNDYIYLGGDSPTEIVGLKVAQGRLYVFTRNRIFQIIETGVNSGVFKAVDMGSDRGAVAPESIVRVRDVIFFLSSDGVYYFDGRNTFEVSIFIRDYFQSDTLKLDLDNLGEAVAFYANNKYTLCLRSYGASAIDTALEFSVPAHSFNDPLAGKSSRAWTERDVTWVAAAVSCSNAGKESVYVGKTNGYLAQVETGYTTTTSKYRTGQIQLDALLAEHGTRKLALIWKPTTASVTATLKYYLDGDTDRTSSASIDLKDDDGYFPLEISVESRTIQIELSWSNSGLSEVVRIYGLAMLGEAA